MLPLRLEVEPFVVFCLLSSSVGPLHSDLEYTVTSQKEGYVLTAVEGTVGDFKAYALAGVSFEVTLHVFKGAASLGCNECDVSCTKCLNMAVATCDHTLKTSTVKVVSKSVTARASCPRGPSLLLSPAFCLSVSLCFLVFM
jgi:hypothetical protein